ncbi:Pho80 protein [Starmerella bacillaris]|uniref:Pho80 protein n=1 Tax=Starmerella bacillaris TaxID=1247836 RepID=A0AAV5RJ56_STABA|nr:Pho80 protein [Starmerella bacillaris]
MTEGAEESMKSSAAPIKVFNDTLDTANGTEYMKSPMKSPDDTKVNSRNAPQSTTRSINQCSSDCTSSNASLRSPKDYPDIEDQYEANEQAFINTHIAELAKQVAAVISDHVSENDLSPFTSDKLTRFHSRAPPSINVYDYLVRIIKFCNIDKAMLLVLLYLVDLFTESYSIFVLNSLTVHRFMITALAVASKGLCDHFCTNTYYAKIGGVTVLELNLLEVEFLTRVRYRIVPPQHVLPKYYHLLKCKSDLFSQSVPNEATDAGIQPQNTANSTSAATQSLNESTKRLARDDASKSSDSFADNAQLAHPAHSGIRSLKVVKDTLKFFHSNKKKRSNNNPPA